MTALHHARILLLAAGRGKRAGGPKAWAPHGAGKSLLEAHLEFARGMVGVEGLSVAIQPEWLERCSALSPNTVWVVAEPDAPPMDSLQRLIKLSPKSRSFVLHVDMPIFDPAVYTALCAANADVAVPAYKGRRGHPVLLCPAALDRVLALNPAKDRLDAWLKTADVAEVPVETDLILANKNE